ncbi:hypothetical protein D6S13_23995 [Salmonella enterica subsp. enterica]|nr:hypothetical protein [Salmonella enterica subsp. enterica]
MINKADFLKGGHRINEDAPIRTKKKDDKSIKRTTVETSREYHSEIKTYCFQNDLKMVDFLRECLERGFNEIRKERGI